MNINTVLWQGKFVLLVKMIVVDQLHMALFSASKQTHVTVNK